MLFRSDYKCSGISVIEHSETSGLGANAASTGEVGVKFRAQFVGEDENIALSKVGGNIDALTDRKSVVVMAMVEHMPICWTSTGLFVIRPSVYCFFLFIQPRLLNPEI